MARRSRAAWSNGRQPGRITRAGRARGRWQEATDVVADRFRLVRRRYAARERKRSSITARCGSGRLTVYAGDEGEQLRGATRPARTARKDLASYADPQPAPFSFNLAFGAAGAAAALAA